ncbi:MAG: adenosylcobalamin-dependent ribonucleoside-diphosphate reductase, partial [Sulfitobacter sp.]|nr:adenosylcobalamin-dependent ribonucleoside-diphosphate reductase [Sulfitobacter sp.]
MSAFAAPIAEQIWDMKYRFKQADGTPIDATVEETWRRIARDLAQAETDKDQWAERFYGALEDFKYLPAGRITAGAGTARRVTLFNCFVMGTVPDSMGGIFDMLKEAALTMQQGGGIGYDFSTIRPKGADVKGVSADASGPLSFMDVWDAMCRTIMSAGSRRGAMMATMRCDHPDIESFIAAKSDPARLRMFNMSVLVKDAFMEAVKADGPWELTFDGQVYRTLKARDLWNGIMQATYDYAEPGVIFIDRINQANNLNYCETIAATNPCGEQPLPPYGACLLGSINLARLVSDPFEETAQLNETALQELVATAVRMMDNVVDVSKFPLEAQAREAQAKRRIGLGVTGLADALLMLGLRYGSDEAAAQTEAWLKAIARASYLASVDLAKEKGAFPLFDAEAYLASGNMAQMDEDVREAIRTHGIRNALLTSIAPTGTISLYAGNVSSGIEPVFAYAYTRKVLQKDGSRTEEEVVDYAVQMWRDKFGDR